MAKPKIDPTTPAAPAAPDDDFTPPGVDLGPFDVPADWISPEGRARLVERFKAAEREAAKLAKAQAIIDKHLNAPTRVVIVESKTKPASKKDSPAPTAKLDKLKPPKKARLAPALEPAIRALKEKFPPDGKVPIDLRLGDITKIVRTWCKEHKQIRIEHKWKLPDRRSVGRAVKKLGRAVDDLDLK